MRHCFFSRSSYSERIFENFSLMFSQLPKSNQVFGYFIILTLNDTMPLNAHSIFLPLNDPLGGHSGAFFGGAKGTNFNIPSRVSFSHPDSFQVFYYYPEGHSVSFFIRIVSSRYHSRNSSRQEEYCNTLRINARHLFKKLQRKNSGELRRQFHQDYMQYWRSFKIKNYAM